MGILDAPHDTFFGLLFGRPEVAADWLRAVLPARVARAIAWRTFARAADRSFGMRLRRNEADRVFVARLRRGRGRVVWVLEHKAGHDAGLGSQSLRYAVDLRHGIRRGPRAAEPFVVVAVLHHGQVPWRVPRHPHLAGLSKRVGAALDDLQPRMPLVVDDLTRMDEATLLARPLLPTTRLALLCLRFLRHATGRQVLAALTRWADLLRDACSRHGDEIADAVAMYALAVSDVRPRPLAERITRILHRPEDMVMSTLLRYYLKGKAEGLAEGKSKWKAKGKAEGRAEGRAEGKAEGMAEGEAAGRAATLLRLLGKRFGRVPAAVTRRIRAASAPQLERWTDRILEAKTLAEVIE